MILPADALSQIMSRLDAIETRIASLETSLRPTGTRPRRMTGRGYRPRFYSDEPVRRAVESLYDTASIDGILATLEERFGLERTPSRSAIGRYLQQLDRERSLQ